MWKLTVLLAFLGMVVFASGAAGVERVGSVGIGHGVAVHGGDTDPCPPSTLMVNYDGTGEHGYCWQYGGMVAPYYGAFAEGYAGPVLVCGVALYLTQIGYYTGQRTDLYVWDSDGVNPTNVLTMMAAVSVPGSIAFWPSISQHDMLVTETPVGTTFFVGYWGNWPGGGPCPWYIAADLDGFGGLPRTHIAPGIGYPTGWNDVSIVWGPTMAIGIGAWTKPITPTEDKTWGSIKQLYH